METSNRLSANDVFTNLDPCVSTSLNPAGSSDTDARKRKLVLRYPFSVEQIGRKHILEFSIVRTISTTMNKLSRVTRPLFGNAALSLELDREEAFVAVRFDEEEIMQGDATQLHLDHESPQEFAARALGYLEAGQEAEFGTAIGDQQLIPRFRQLAHEIGANKLTAIIIDGENEVVVEMSPLDKIPLESEAILSEYRTERGKVTSLCTNGFFVDHKTFIIAPRGKELNVSIGDSVVIRTKATPKQMRCIQLESVDEIISSEQLSFISEKNK